MSASRSLFAALLLASTLLVTSLQAATTNDALAEKLLNAVAKNDHATMVADADARFKAALTPEALAKVSEQLAVHTKGGYKITPLGVLRQLGYEVNLYKITFNDGSDDVLMRMAMKDGKVGGFFLQ